MFPLPNPLLRFGTFIALHACRSVKDRCSPRKVRMSAQALLPRLTPLQPLARRYSCRQIRCAPQLLLLRLSSRRYKSHYRRHPGSFWIVLDELTAWRGSRLRQLQSRSEQANNAAATRSASPLAILLQDKCGLQPAQVLTSGDVAAPPQSATRFKRATQPLTRVFRWIGQRGLDGPGKLFQAD